MKKFVVLAATIALAVLPALPASAQLVQIDRVPTDHPIPPPTTSGHPDVGPADAPYSCGSQFGVLPRVYPAQVAGVNDEKKVWVTELCANLGMLHNEGNAAYLEPTIAQNDVLVDVLRRHSYFPEDVFAVKMVGADTIHLYVYHF